MTLYLSDKSYSKWKNLRIVSSTHMLRRIGDTSHRRLICMTKYQVYLETRDRMFIKPMT